MSASVLLSFESFEVTPWRDPVVEAAGWRADTDEMLVYAQAILGPTASTLWWRTARYVADGSSVIFAPGEFAGSFGVMPSVAAKALDRLAHFGIVRFTRVGFEIRTHVPPFPVRWQDRLPAYLADAYRNYQRTGVAA